MAQEIANHDENGINWPNISFCCLLKVKDDDPTLSAQVGAGCMSPLPPPPPNWRIWDYIDAKQQGNAYILIERTGIDGPLAYAAGLPIPTLAEFEASTRVDSARTSLDCELHCACRHDPEVDPGIAAHRGITRLCGDGESRDG